MFLSKRRFLTLASTGVAATMTGGLPAWAGDAPISLNWSDLIPGDVGKSFEAMRNQGIVQHGDSSMATMPQDIDASVTDEYDGKLVRIPGYLLPLDFEGTALTSGLLVPYVGACIHVPPPPPNQLIFITSPDPYQSQGLFEPVYVTGVMGTSATATQFAEVGYAISADRIEPYG